MHHKKGKTKREKEECTFAKIVHLIQLLIQVRYRGEFYWMQYSFALIIKCGLTKLTM